MLRMQIAVAVLAVLPCGPLEAGLYEDCILQNLKGVQVAAAVAEIRSACRDKADEDKARRVREFGKVLPVETMKADAGWEVVSPTTHSIRITNTSPDLTVTYLRLLVAPAAADGKSCDRNLGRQYVYTPSVKPKEGVRFTYPAVDTNYACVYVTALLGRAPSWRDIISFGSNSPLAVDPLADID